MQTNICKALAKAQREFSPVVKNATNPHFRSKYADLQAVLEAVAEPLHNAGILLIQAVAVVDGSTVLHTDLVEVESGESIRSTYPLLPAKQNDPQALGSAVTYARRYSILALLGLAPEDDDGNAASQRPAPQKTQKQPPQKPQQEQPAAAPQKPLPPLSEEDAVLLEDWRQNVLGCNTVPDLVSMWDRMPLDFRPRLKDVFTNHKLKIQGGK